jgi:signal transduction histidine kinase
MSDHTNTGKGSQKNKKKLESLESIDSKDLEELSDIDKAIEIIALQNEELEALRNNMDDQKDKLEKIYNKMRNRTIDLFGRMVDLKKAKKTISLQNEQLEKQRYEIERQRSSLEKTYKKFRERTIELFGKMVDLKKAKKTISQQNEKLENQRMKLDEINATKDKFFSIIAHDLKNPIAGFLQLTDLLSENYYELSDNETKELISLMNSNSKQLYSLLENLLHWSRAQTGNISYEPQSFKMTMAAEETIGLLKMTLENKKMVFINRVNKNTMVYADYNMTNTILRNLFSNAIKFSHEGKRIEMDALDLEDYIRFSVTDFGVGISHADQEKIFHIGHNIAKNGTANEKGTGLGLLVCKEFVERHDGTIWLESEPQKGTTFYFTLPKSKK